MKEKLEQIKDKHAQEMYIVLGGKLPLQDIKNFCDSLMFDVLDVVGQRMKENIVTSKTR